LFGFAMLNRYQLAPALLGTEAARARRVLLRSLAWQTGCGGAILMAAALLSQLQPGMKMPP
jgi:putative copper export protein